MTDCMKVSASLSPHTNDGLAIGSGGGRWWALSGVGKEAEEGPGADNVNEGPSAGITADGTGVSWRDGRGGTGRMW